MQMEAIQPTIFSPPPTVLPLDEGRWHLWQLVRGLFPAHARAVQTATGSIAISWSLDGDPHTAQDTAAPIMIRADDRLYELLASCGLDDRLALERTCMESVRHGLIGYDPSAAFPQVRVIPIVEWSARAAA